MRVLCWLSAITLVACASGQALPTSSEQLTATPDRGATSPPEFPDDAAFDTASPTPTATSTPTPTPGATSSSPAPAPTPTTTPTPTGTPGPRRVHEPGWTAFATVGGVTLLHPAARVERVGFHESNHDGARQMSVADSAAAAVTLETRERGTGSRTAADIVVDPDGEIRAPVTGTVKRAGTYVLYCEHSDDFAVIEPDDHPGWEVKILHIDGVRVTAGDRVVAGDSLLAGRPTRLPFRSQVDDETAEPSWPHVHIEVVDPSIPDRPSSGGGC